jgi:transposase
MALLAKDPLRPLSSEEQRTLERIAQATSERVDRVRRAQAILTVAQGQSLSQATRQAGWRHHSGVAKLVARFNRQGMEAIDIAPGRGRRPTYDTAARAQIVAMAQQPPRRREDQTATWSLRTLQRRLRRDGLPTVGTSTIRRVLQDAGSSYQRTRTWCPTGTALRKRKAGVVRVVDPQTEEKTSLIDLAYRVGEEVGVPVWTQDEAGPYQALPHPGASWQPAEHPARQPHEYIRGGTAKMLTLFRPATGEVRAQGVTSAPNAVLHPWLQEELTQILAGRPEPPPLPAGHPLQAHWATWLGRAPGDPLPPLRLILVWDNLAGHTTPALIRWLGAQGALPLYTPLSGSWLNMAESVQRIIVRRALCGQHPRSSAEIIAWLEETVAGWNAEPTPFIWDGKRRERRRRARTRRLGGSAAVAHFGYTIAA